MLAELEAQLADFLGARLGAPFAGRVDVVPGSGQGNQPSITVAVREARRLAPDFGSTRPEQAPGADDPRRVVRLDVDVELVVTPANNGGRPQLIAGLDALLYELDGPEARAAGTLASPADDPGFVLDRLEVRSALTDPDEGSPRVVLNAVGWFWPPDAPGITGAPIAEARVRTVARPVDLAPWPLRIRAGDDAVTFTLTMAATGTSVLDGDGVDIDEFGRVALRLIDAGGRPGAGSLIGGADGPAGSRIVTLTDGTTTIDYAPPADAASDHLVVAVARPDTGDGAAIGVELARFSIEVGS
jgi:hypothetical protein